MNTPSQSIGITPAPRFDASYYEKLIRQHGYDPLRDDIGTINFSLGSLSPEDLSRTWICHSHGDIFSEAAKTREKVQAISGVGLSGVPHLGTLSQILRAIRIQREGIPVKFVLGDLDAFNGKGIPLPVAKDLAGKFKNFMIRLGFDASAPNELQEQYDELEILRTMYLTGHYMEDAEFGAAEEDLHTFYAQKGKVDSEMSYRRKLSLHLMVAGWYHQQCEGWKHILVSLGIDEHQYVQFGQRILAKMQEKRAFDGVFDRCTIAGLYSNLIGGFNGYPKMSKSFPESGIIASMTRQQIRDIILSKKNDKEGEAPEDNVVYQAMAACSLLPAAELHEAARLCEGKDPAWREAKERYAAHLYERITSLWSR
jgi:tryptophanyl-tRNA synthetase